MSTTRQIMVHQPLTAEEVRAFRHSLGMTQMQFAAKLDVSLRAVEVWESASASRPPHYLRFAFAAIKAGLEPWAKGAEEVAAAKAAQKPMTGFMATLTPEQKQAALAYRGDDTHPAPETAEGRRATSKPAKTPAKPPKASSGAVSQTAGPSVQVGPVTPAAGSRLKKR